MCLIAFAWNAHPRWRLLLAGNRDEFHDRPSAALAPWPDAPVIGGRDLQAGGTWLGVTRDGRCAAVTNVRDPRDPHDGASRGLLAADYLRGSQDAAAYAQQLLASEVAYRPFNLLLFDAGAALYVTNRPQPLQVAVTAGMHALSNARLNTAWPKTRWLMQQCRAWLDRSPDPEDFGPLFAALANENVAVDAELPDTGVGRERERLLSPVFIRGERYGTRASTVLAIAHDGHGRIVERRFGPGGRPDGQTGIDW